MAIALHLKSLVPKYKNYIISSTELHMIRSTKIHLTGLISSLSKDFFLKKLD